MDSIFHEKQPSTNMDDSGFFSVQVISKALFVWELVSIPIGSSEAGIASVYPERECAFICNFREHWLTIRKLGNQWFNLNSLLTGPELISDTYLSMFLAQLQKEGTENQVSEASEPVNQDELRRKREAFFNRPILYESWLNRETGELLDSAMTESAMLEAAIKMSIESVEQKT
eukprot:XP_011679451.1 PREDICTED: ataxin-3-like [Strongylocentrotus purpuratus]